MKRLTFLLIFVASFGYSQSNLVFNRVLNFKLTSSQTATVPAGKVWKVENFTNQSGNVADQFYLDTSDADFGSPSITSGYIDGVVVWLKEGSDIRGYPAGTLFSILEFDVVPVSTTSTGSGGLSSEGLEFNQVINYSNNIIVSGTGEINDTIVVPEGKVWKLTRVTLTKAYNPTSNFVYEPEDASNAAIYLGGILIFYRPPTSGYSTSSYNSYPIWINSGTKELAVGDNDTIDTRYLVTFTGIEYNIPQ